MLDGAKALAIPTRYGQSLSVITDGMRQGILSWLSYEESGELWFSAQFRLADLELLNSSDAEIAQNLLKILHAIRQDKPDFLTEKTIGLSVSTKLDFPRVWGLGTSSTLIASIARWANVNPYALLESSFGGSGYDLACAYATGPITFQRSSGAPVVKTIKYNPSLVESLFFVYLGRKQNSREGIAHYRRKVGENPDLVESVTALTENWINCTDLATLEAIIREHESLVSETVALPRAKQLYFSDYWGEIKSLGAWGGDFILVSSNRDKADTYTYFKDKGFNVFIPWDKMVLSL